MQVGGIVKINVCTQNVQATLDVTISSDLKENMLISCDGLRKLWFGKRNACRSR